MVMTHSFIGKALHKLTTGSCMGYIVFSTWIYLLNSIRFTVFIRIVPAAVSYEKLCNTKFNNIILITLMLA